MARSSENLNLLQSVAHKETPEQLRSRTMRAVKSRNTTPEIVVRRTLHAAGLRYRLHAKNLPGSPDLALSSRSSAIFVHGCFWHQHGCKRSTIPSTRTDYWIPKLVGNVARDKRNLAALRRLGWKVFIIWECETKDAAKVARLVEKVKRLPKLRGR